MPSQYRSKNEMGPRPRRLALGEAGKLIILEWDAPLRVFLQDLRGGEVVKAPMSGNGRDLSLWAFTRKKDRHAEYGTPALPVFSSRQRLALGLHPCMALSSRRYPPCWGKLVLYSSLLKPISKRKGS